MNSSKKIAFVIQARTGSSRLPGKTMMIIEGKPMLWHVVNRLRYSKLCKSIIIATTTSKKDNIIVDFCKRNNILFFRGSENDVLERYYETALKFNLDIIVRVTSDCPLIDPVVSDNVISAYLKRRSTHDAASNNTKRTFPRGLDTEVFSFETLKKCHINARKDYHREHVTVYFYEHPEMFNVYTLGNDEDLSHLRWTVDEDLDLQAIREIFKRLSRRNNIFLMKDILEIIHKEPHLAEINKHIKQNKVR